MSNSLKNLNCHIWSIYLPAIVIDPEADAFKKLAQLSARIMIPIIARLVTNVKKNKIAEIIP